MESFTSEELLEDFKDYIFPVFVIAAGLTAYFQNYQLSNILIYTVLGISVFAVRELGQRVMALFMDAYVETNYSPEGSTLTLMTAALAAGTSTSLALLIPTTNEFSQEKHEHWGKSVDAMWSKRQYWVASSGTAALTLVALIAFQFDWLLAIQAFTVFTLTNLVPLRDLIIEGDTDGSYILFHSGFTWLFFAGVNLILFGYATF